MTVETATRLVRATWLGRVPYAEGLRRQAEAAAAAAASPGEETLLLLEHEPVFTLGRNATRADVLLSEDELARRGIEVFETDRGGKVTYHGPGQLVGYPILRLDGRRDVKAYVTAIEETLIRALADLGVAAERSPRPERVTSVWVGEDKIAAIGIHVARWITTHGFALNVTEEPMEGFAGIVPCGIVDGGVTSIERVLGRGGRGGAPSMETVRRAVVHRFAEVFAREIVES
jgi:lipoyl(octanoyl) transferase